LVVSILVQIEVSWVEKLKHTLLLQGTFAAVKKHNFIPPRDEANIKTCLPLNYFWCNIPQRALSPFRELAEQMRKLRH